MKLLLAFQQNQDCLQVCLVPLQSPPRSTFSSGCVHGQAAGMGSLTYHCRDSPLEDSDLKDTYLIPRNVMAEPDYIDDDNPELIRPQKLVNPVKTSRNHQDLHRELLMNQKRGLAPQNKPELQKVMEKRKRDQVIKQKEEEAQKKKSDLEIELLKRQQKLEQLELEKQKLREEQENAPEFVKVKGNLRRTGQEVAQAQES
ncbi:protein FAM107B isoform X2 [Delphinus delphis]|uniref:protein FAM107B isoform X2 n=1 Tax=Delphinus delphis TaxID=9728 RepID=UPI0028C41DE0|nr:protein FAM107B isoform X2 [Delphinus delphis]